MIDRLWPAEMSESGTGFHGKVLQIGSDMHQADHLQKKFARFATTPDVAWAVVLLHILQTVQVRMDLQ